MWFVSWQPALKEFLQTEAEVAGDGFDQLRVQDLSLMIRDGQVVFTELSTTQNRLE